MHRLKNHDCVCAEIKERPPLTAIEMPKLAETSHSELLDFVIVVFLAFLGKLTGFLVSTMFNPSAMEHGQAEWDMKHAFFAKTVDGTNLKYGLNMLKSH